MDKFKEVCWVLFKSKGLEMYRVAFLTFFIIGWIMGIMIYGFVLHNIYLVFLAWAPVFSIVFYIIYLIGKGFIRDFKDAWMTRDYTRDK